MTGMKKIYAAILFWSMACTTNGQDSSAGKQWQLTGFTDIYYQYDFNKPLSRERPPFVYNHKKHNRVSVNLAMLKLSYNGNRWTGNVALMAGDYATYNLAAEPRWLQYVSEANVGYRFTSKLSAEAGVLPSHIGFESAVSKDCWNLSRSFLAENSPYYETGVKLNYAFNTKWTAAILLLQGWQNMKDLNRSKAIGTQLQFKPNNKWLFNSSSFVGNELPDTVAATWRVFHDLYLTNALTKNINIALLFDVGLQGNEMWWGSALMLQYKLSAKWKTAVRAEYYNDPHSVIITAFPATGVQGGGYSFNLDFTPLHWLSVRTEMKWLQGANAVFDLNGQASKKNSSLLVSLAAAF
jgi:hypothetical protein